MGNRDDMAAFESRFIALCEATLGIGHLRRDASLIAQGASSMRMMQLVARLYEQFDVVVDLHAITGEVTADAILALIAPAPGGGPAAEAATQFPLSELQLAFWDLQQYRPAHVAYNEGVSHRIQGDLDLALCQQVLVELVARQAALRSAHVEVDGVPVQRVLPLEEVAPRLALEVEDLSGHADPWAACAARHRAAHATAFDLARPPCFRALVWKLAERDWVVSWVVSHIVTDFWSVQVIRRAAAALYLALRERRPVEPRVALLGPDACPRFSDEDAAYWSAQFARPYADVDLAPRRPALKSYRGEMVRGRIAVDLAALEARRAALAVSMASLTFAASCLLIGAVGGQDDVVIGVPYLHPRIGPAEDAVGMLLNSLPVRVQIDPAASLAAHVARCHGALRAAMRHAAYPSRRLIASLDRPRNLARAPLYEHLFSYDDADLGAVAEAGGLRASALELPRGTSKFDLGLFVARDGAALALRIEYCRDVFGEADARGLAARYGAVLDAVVRDPAAPARALIDALRGAAPVGDVREASA